MSQTALFLAQELDHDDAVTAHCRACAQAWQADGDVRTIAAHNRLNNAALLSPNTSDVPFEASNIFDWSMMVNNEFKRIARQQIDTGSLSLVHANDWLTVPAGISIAKRYNAYLVLSLHSTENNRGFNGEHAPLISNMEWQGCYEADRVMVARDEVWNSVLFDLDVPEQKVVHINGETDTERIQSIYAELGGVTL